MTHPPDANPIVIACGTDERYAMPLAAMLASLAVHLDPGRSADVSVISTGLSDRTRGRLARAAGVGRAAVRVRFVPLDPGRLADFPHFGHLTPDTLLRLFVPDLLPAADHALYLDCDCLVLADVGRLWDLPVAPHAVLAAPDLVVQTVSGEWGLPNYRELGLPAGGEYFNAGILPMNLARWRAEGIGPAALAYVSDHRQIVRFADQDALNALLYHARGDLDLTWNANVNHMRYVDAWPDGPLKRQVQGRRRDLMRSPAICHFVGEFKPWRPGYQVPFLGRWMYYLWRSRWFGPVAYARWTATWAGRHAAVLFSRKVLKRPDPT